LRDIFWANSPPTKALPEKLPKTALPKMPATESIRI
jgi:hypothetical protein